jgi:predicted transcriptional regulator
MEVQFDPDLDAQLDRMAAESGRAKNDVVQDAVAGYFGEVAQLRAELSRRLGEVEAGEVDLLSLEEVEGHFRRKSLAHRGR